MPTPARIARVAAALHHRQPDVRLFLDQIHNPHNLSAILRTADAVGVGEVVWSWAGLEDGVASGLYLNPEVAQGSEKWVRFTRVADLAPAIARARAEGLQIVATHLSADAVDHVAIDWTRPTGLILGNEHCGCSQEVLALADRNVVIPMFGFVQSLNVSVATAILLFELLRQRRNAGFYQRTLPEPVVREFAAAWKLQDEGYPLAELLAPPAVVPPAPPGTGHRDARTRPATPRRLTRPPRDK